MELSLLDIYNQMGNFAKGVVYVLALMSIWTLSIAIKKWWDLRQAQRETRKFAPEFSQFLEEDNLGEAVTLADKYKKSHVARVLGGESDRSEEHTSELQSQSNLVCRLLLEKKKKKHNITY